MFTRNTKVTAAAESFVYNCIHPIHQQNRKIALHANKRSLAKIHGTPTTEAKRKKKKRNKNEKE